VAKTVKVAATGFSIVYVITFVLMIPLKLAMQLFWGSIRNLQVIFTLVLIKFRQNSTMNTFMSGMSKFAKADVYNGEDYYAENFSLVVTLGKNAQFEFYGSGDMLMLTNSGSFFVIQG
jgi:hypothetical protein